jgi:hypothetical protein
MEGKEGINANTIVWVIVAGVAVILVAGLIFFLKP